MISTYVFTIGIAILILCMIILILAHQAQEAKYGVMTGFSSVNMLAMLLLVIYVICIEAYTICPKISRINDADRVTCILNANRDMDFRLRGRFLRDGIDMAESELLLERPDTSHEVRCVRLRCGALIYPPEDKISKYSYSDNQTVVLDDNIIILRKKTRHTLFEMTSWDTMDGVPLVPFDQGVPIVNVDYADFVHLVRQMA